MTNPNCMGQPTQSLEELAMQQPSLTAAWFIDTLYSRRFELAMRFDNHRAASIKIPRNATPHEVATALRELADLVEKEAPDHG